MLENLLNSKLKRKLLNIFFYFPQRGFYLNELRVMTKGSGSGLHQALRELARTDAILVAAKRNKRYFRINPHFHMSDELKDLVWENKQDFEDEIGKRLKGLDNLKLIALCGIFTMQTHLNVDLLLVGERINRIKLGKVLAEIKKLVGQEINYAVMNRREYEYRKSMSDRLIRDVLDHPHIVVLNNLRLR